MFGWVFLKLTQNNQGKATNDFLTHYKSCICNGDYEPQAKVSALLIPAGTF